MKYALVSSIFLVGLLACNRPPINNVLQTTIDSLQQQLNTSYKPGLGEFMLSVQVHHAKLWFAGNNQNWPLADFEINEIKEALEDIRKYCADRPETKTISMILAPIDSVSNAIKQQNGTQFKSSYYLLTATCNTCHSATSHAFNVITIPSKVPFSNQDFNPVK